MGQLTRLGARFSTSLLLTVAACEGREHFQSAGIPQWSLTQLFVIGDSPATELNRVSSVLWLPDGRLLIADVGARRLLLVSASGEEATQLGREGSGPGEYRLPGSLAALGDTIVVHDPGNARLSLFTPDGSWVRHLTIPPISGPHVRLYRVPEAEFYAVGVQTSDRSKSSLTYVRYDATGPSDTLLVPLTPNVSTTPTMCRGSDGGVHFFTTPWSSSQLDRPGPDGLLLTAATSAYAIKATNSTGDTVARFTGPKGTVGISDSEWNDATAELRDYLAKDPSANCNARSLARPATKPILRDLFWSDDGHLWVERYDSTGSTFDVFERDGSRIAALKAPARVQDVEPHVRNSRLAVVASGPDGGNVVRVFRILREGAAPDDARRDSR